MTRVNTCVNVGKPNGKADILSLSTIDAVRIRHEADAVFMARQTVTEPDDCVIFVTKNKRGR